MIRIATIAVFAAALATGCATAPKPLRGEFDPISPADAGGARQSGSQVRWGGEIIGIETGPDRSCFELLGKPLTDSARPQRADETAGRFIACRPGFYDPALFAEGREVTVTGRIEDYETRRIGQYDYTYPRVAADVIYLWPERSEQDVYYYPPVWPHWRSAWWGSGFYVPHRHFPPRVHRPPRKD